CMPTRSMGTISVGSGLIVPTLQRGNAAQDAPRPLWRVTQSVTGCMPTRSMGTISVGSGLIVPTL
ncbi:hypothetical protein, partial [Pseudomonas viridiflava]|uniref:hypothetical protein n=1 Tax=Pseudomonas viridiflava TaxID=33069 RepID=UPI00197C170E